MNRLAVRPLEPADTPHLRSLLADTFLSAPYSKVMDGPAILRQILQHKPLVVHPVHWQHQVQLGAWLRDRLLGFVDISAGFDGSHPAGTDDALPVGLLRYLHLPGHSQAAEDVAAVLLKEAEWYWRKAGMQQVLAFAHGTGYPDFQVGVGLLPGNWDRQFRALTQAGYRLQDRYYCMRRPVQQPVMEVLPRAGLTFAQETVDGEQHYQMFDGIEQVAFARILSIQVSVPADANPVAYLANLEVAPEWRGQSIGRWLLRRILNDVSLLRYREIALHVNHVAHTAISLFSQHGFTELNYRGYVFEKQL
jgi:ribosomal protein S18 acetylase RimI-like enzyme